MATAQKISELTTAGPLTGPELVPIVQNGGTVQTFVSTLAIFATSTLSSDIAAVSTRLDQVSARVSTNAAAITSINTVVAAVSARTSVNAAAITSINGVVGGIETRVNTVSAVAAANTAAITSVNTVVSALDTRVANVSASVSVLNVQMTGVLASISAINSALATIDTSAINTLAAQVSTLEIRVSTVSAAVSANAASITSTNAVVSALDTRVASVSASVSALQIQVDAVSAALTSTNNVVSVLEIRVSNASAAIVSANTVIANVSALVSALDVRVAAVSASVSALQVQLDAVSAAVSVNSAAITSINAVVSTKVNRVGDFMDAVQYIEFDTSTSFAVSVGRLTWDSVHGTLNLGLIGGNADLLLGQREVVYCFNNSGATILKGKVVQVTGASGQRLTIDLARADSDLNSLTVLGVALENVSANASGFVATDGMVNNVNTQGFTDGQIVYLSPVSAGELTPTKPIAPQHLVQIGYVVKGGSVGGGSIYAKVQNGYELGELHDVKTSSSASIANNEVIAWNTSAGVFTNSTILIDTQASVSALQIQLNAVSAATSVNAAAITSINNVVSALEIRVSTVSAQASAIQSQVNAVSVLVSALDVRVAAVSASVSALQVQVNAVSAAVSGALVSVSQRVLKAGDTMTGQLVVTVSSDAVGVSITGGLAATSAVYFTGDSALLLQSGTTATRPVSVVPGLIRFNSGSNNFEGYTSASWGAIGGGGVTEFSGGATGLTPSTSSTGSITLGGLLATGSGGTGTSTTFTAGSIVFAGTSGVYSQNNSKLFWDNSNLRLGVGVSSPGSSIDTNGAVAAAFFINPTVVSASYTIPTNYNAGSFGPITVASGVTVAVPSGSTWTIT